MAKIVLASLQSFSRQDKHSVDCFCGFAVRELKQAYKSWCIFVLS
jgi:hypothetical protein